jgi:putative salt-induced outer membrane protein
MLLAAISVFAQAAPEAPKTYTGNFGGGIALTGGNTDTKNFNLTLNLTRAPDKARNVIKTEAAYLRGNENNVLSVDRTSFKLRDEFTLSGRTFIFGQLDYLRDQFKQIIFLWAPTGGVGYKFVNNDKTKFELDGGAGGILERDPGRTAAGSGSLTSGESFQQKISTAATFTQSLTALWKTDDFNDSLTVFNTGVTTSITKNLELKLSFIDNYKNKPASATVKKNDTAFVTAFVIKY